MIWIGILVAAVVAAVVVAIVIVRRRKGGALHVDQINRSRERIARNASAFDALVALYADAQSETMRDRMRDVASKLRYCNPDASHDVAVVDDKIADMIAELRAELERTADNDVALGDALAQIRAALAHRGTKG